MDFTFLFAQMEPPMGLAAWLACGAFMVMLTNQALRLKERLVGEKRPQEIFPQPLEVRKVGEPVSRDYCERNHQVSSRRIDAVEQELRELREERRESAVVLEEKIETVSRDIPEMERRFNTANEARFEKVHTRINEVLGEVRELRGAINQL